MAEDLLVEAKGITVAFGDRAVLDGVDLRLHRGEIVTLIGLNGAGKSTLVRVVLGLLRPDAGTVRLRPGLRVGYAPQHLAVDATLPMTVARFLTLGGRAPRARLEAVLDEVGARHVLDIQLARVSGGEMHRILLARALLRAPDLLVLDEPMSGVDVSGQTELYRLIADIRDRRGCGVLLVSHDLHLVMAATDIVLCLNGHVCCSGHPTAVARDPAFIALFGRRMAETLAVYHHHHDHRHDAGAEAVPLEAEGAER
jgi:zinc transport system ATP-binding protein